MKTIYKSEDGKRKILDLYDKQLQRLNTWYKDLYVNTSFGKTHLIETGNLDGEPLLVFHGGNATTAYNLLYFEFMMDDYQESNLYTFPIKKSALEKKAKNEMKPLTSLFLLIKKKSYIDVSTVRKLTQENKAYTVK